MSSRQGIMYFETQQAQGAGLPRLPTGKKLKGRKSAILADILSRPPISATSISEPKFDCHFCSFIGTKAELKQHRLVHDKKKPYECLSCPFKCANRAALTIHIRKHTEEKPFVCERCNSRFKQLASLRIHMMKHTGKKLHPCHLCEYSASLKKDLQMHILEMHTPETPSSYLSQDAQGPMFDNISSFIPIENFPIISEDLSSNTDQEIFKCRYCPFVGNKIELKRHRLTHDKQKPYQCLLCTYKCASSSELEVHNNKHTKEKPYTCNLCNIKFRYPSSLRSHKKLHYYNSMYDELHFYNVTTDANESQHNTRDQKVQKPSLSNTNLVNHDFHTMIFASNASASIDSSSEKRFFCPNCSFVGTEFEFQQHQHMNDKKELYQCSECPFKCSNFTTLATHRRRHIMTKINVCDQCNAKFIYPSSLREHIMIKHPQYGPYLCSFCDFQAIEKSSMDSHMRTHYVEVQSSMEQYFQQPWLHNVSELQHSNENPVNLSQNMQTNHWEPDNTTNKVQHDNQNAINLTLQPFTILAPQSEQINKCRFCSFQGNKIQLKEHRQSHDKRKPYKCSVCPYMCASNAILVQHFRKHTKDKPFVCEICGSKLGYEASLRKHMMRHTGEKPYGCTLCDYRAIQKNSLMRHMLKHTQKTPSTEQPQTTFGSLVIDTNRVIEPMYNCQYCTFVGNENEIKIHMEEQNMHSRREPKNSNMQRPFGNNNFSYACTKCSYTTIDKQAFQFHTLEHL